MISIEKPCAKTCIVLAQGSLINHSPMLIPFKTTAVKNTVTQMIEVDTTIAIGNVIGNPSFR
ncbi:hypothetical protein SAMN05444672_106173 [Bacillus sp. OK838]|nr:hypothetical protein SAMN05444672_106173 [Bacillus sp. OK838]